MKFIAIEDNGEIKGLTESEWALIFCLDSAIDSDKKIVLNELKHTVNFDRVAELLKYYYGRLPARVDHLRSSHIYNLAFPSTHHTQFHFLSQDYKSQIDSILILLEKYKSKSDLRPIDEAAILFYKIEAGLIGKPYAKELKKKNTVKLYQHLNDFCNKKKSPSKGVIEIILPYLKEFPGAYKLAYLELEK